MSRFLRWAVAFLAVPLAVGASTSPLLAQQVLSASDADSQPRPTPSSLTLDLRVWGTPRHNAMGVHFGESSLAAWSCAGACKPTAEVLELDLPPEAAELSRKHETIRLQSGEKVLWVRYGAERFYSVLLMGAPLDSGAGKSSDSALPPPRILLKGWSNESSDGLHLLRQGGSSEISVHGPMRKTLCGRSGPRWVRRFDPKDEKFHRVLFSPLTQEASSTLQAEAYQSGPEDLPVRLFRGEKSSARLPVDGERTIAWDSGHGFVELASQAPALPAHLIFQFAAPVAADSFLYLVADDQSYRVELAATEKMQRVAVPQGAKCLGVVQPVAPVPLVEIMGLEKTQTGTSLTDLVRQLDSADPGHSAQALLVRQKAAVDALVTVYERLSSQGQRRVQRLAPEFPGEGGARLAAKIALVEEGAANKQALLELEARAEAGVEAARAQLLEESGPGAPELAGFLLAASPRDLLEVALSLISETEQAERNRGRGLLEQIVESGEAAESVEALVRSIELQNSGLPRTALVAVMRVLGQDPRLGPELVRLARSGDFREAFVLAPVVYRGAIGSAELRAITLDFLRGALPSEATEMERAALTVRYVEVMLDAQQESALGGLKPALEGRLGAKNVRVREAVLRLDQTYPVVSVELLGEALRRDLWPDVRSAAAGALGATASERGEPQLTEKISKILVGRLRSEKHEQVRRAVARALAKTDDERAHRALRRALQKDKSYDVRADAAGSLGRLCDEHSVTLLTAKAQMLLQKGLSEGQIKVSLAALSALIQIAPPDLDARIAPLRSSDAPGLLRNQVETALLRTSSSCGGK